MAILSHPIGWQGGDIVIPGIVGWNNIALANAIPGALEADIILTPILQADLLLESVLTGEAMLFPMLDSDLSLEPILTAEGSLHAMLDAEGGTRKDPG